MPTDLLIHETVLRRFADLLRGGRLAHAYLLIGPEGVGKFETALAVAKLVNFEAGAREAGCGQCAACRKIAALYHPDLHILKCARGETIKIDDIRSLIAHAQLKPFEAKRKIFILCNTENLTIEGGNALLKTLEEPWADSLLLLTTSVPEKNLATVRSRCQAIHFFSYSSDKLADYLANDYHVEEGTARFLAAFAQGSWGPGEAAL